MSSLECKSREREADSGLPGERRFSPSGDPLVWVCKGWIMAFKLRDAEDEFVIILVQAVVLHTVSLC